ncbi:hypothetical protein L218DRAFT_951690 [Marasmius fiardii PR-910]|nr:hypothetical protein L218DRAFT_951690 [Marasmius fiardii PR-910]
MKNNRELQEIGEAGRLGEFLAFGVVVNLIMILADLWWTEQGEVILFACHMADKLEDRTPYVIDLDQSSKLFQLEVSQPPVSMEILQQKPPLLCIPPLERNKSRIHDDSPLEGCITFPEPDLGQIVVIEYPESPRPFTGPLAETLKEEARMHARSCVIRPGWSTVD